ncbi:MAG: hypothetical protein JWQ35_1744, partial [Bacteriovoracaceae bacterium]|nr:hypothetical protein [Bacteriovoracaceae bacterium]
VLPILPTALPYEEFLRETNLEGYASPADFKMKVLAYAKNAEKIKDDAKRCYSYVGQKRLGSQHRERLELCAKMMTTKPSISPIALAKGYHEIQGTPEMHPPFRDSLIKIQNLFNQRQRGEALKILEEEIAKNPKNPELALAHLKSLKIIQSQGILEKCIHYAQLFQTDLRFLLFRIEVTASTSDRMNLWEGLLSTLSTQPKNARQFYRNLTIPLLVKDLSENKELLNIAKKFLDLFESSASLRYEIAKAYEFQGKTKEALKEFEWILKKANEFSQNRDFISSLNLMEIQTYISSLS